MLFPWRWRSLLALLFIGARRGGRGSHQAFVAAGFFAVRSLPVGFLIPVGLCLLILILLLIFLLLLLLALALLLLLVLLVVVAVFLFVAGSAGSVVAVCPVYLVCSACSVRSFAAATGKGRADLVFLFFSSSIFFFT